MVTILQKWIMGILITIIIASTGTYYLMETGTYMNCPGGWQLIESGPNEGMYDCPTREIELQWCHHLSETGYRCYLGTPIILAEEIEPAVEDKITTDFEVTLKIIATGNEISRTFSRKYPIDLLNYCKYDRYGKPIKCKNMLKQEIEEDLRKWYKIKLRHKIKKKIKPMSLTLIAIGHPDYQHWVGCSYDFMTDKIIC